MVFKSSRDRKQSGFAYHAAMTDGARLSHRNLILFRSELLIPWWQAQLSISHQWSEKGTRRFSFSLCLFYSSILRPNLSVNWFANDVSLLNWFTCLQTHLYVCFFYVFFVILHFLIFTSENYTKTIIRLRLSESRRIFPSTSSRGIFAVIHFAFGE